MTSSLEPLMGILPNSTGMVPGWSPTEIVQMVLIGCISRSRGQKLGFQNATFKIPLVWNYKVSYLVYCESILFSGAEISSFEDDGHIRGYLTSWIALSTK